MELKTAVVRLLPRYEFRISRETQREVFNVIISVEQDGVIGYGEASPNNFYGETADNVQKLLQGIAADLKTRKITSRQQIATFSRLLEKSKAAQCALDIALWDLWGKIQGGPLVQLLNHKQRAIETSVTIGISTPEELHVKVEEVKNYPVIKIKLDKSADLSAVKYIRQRSKAKIRVDANCAWEPQDIPRLSEELAELGVEFIEQPVHPSRDHELINVMSKSKLPLLADESCVVAEDVAKLPGKFHAFNIKLVKCGGITPALRMLADGKRLGLKMMVGCMLETSCLISGGALIAAETDYADLDGNWLIANDPFTGLKSEMGVIHPNTAPGLGVRPLPEANLG